MGAVINGTAAQVFVDGSSIATGTLSLSANNNALTIGSRGAGASALWNGSLDDIRIYNRALSSTEVANLAAGKYADGDNSSATFTLNTALDVNNDLFIQSGVLSPGSNSLAVGGNWNNYSGSSGFVAGTSTATFDKASGTQTLDSGGSSFYNLTHSGAGILQLITNALTVSNNLTNSGGTFDANGLAINLAGNLDNNGGVYTANGNTLTLTGTNQSVLGSATFYNLVKSVSSAATLTFEAAKSFIVSNILTLQGAANNLLSIVSSIVGTQFNINIPSSFTLNFLNIKDLNNSNATSRAVTNSQNSGNNTNITFSATTVTWTGTTSTDWGTATNWDVGYVPNTTDNVVIADVTNDSLLDTTRTVNTLTINSGGVLNTNSQSLTATGAVAINGTLTINSSGSFTTTATGTTIAIGASGTLTNNGSLTIGGAATPITNAGTWTNGTASTVTFTGQSDNTGVTVPNITYGHLVFSKSGTTFTLGAAAVAAGNLTITVGTFNLAGYDLTVGSGSTFSNTGTLTLQGGETITNFTNDTDSGTVAFTGTGTYVGLPTGLSYYHLSFTSTGTYDVNGNLTINGNFINSGPATFTNLSTRTITLSGTTQTFTPGSGSINAAVDITGSSGTVSAGGNFTIGNILSIASGRTLALVSYIMTLGSNLLTNLGIITEGTGYIVGTSSDLYIADSSFDVNDAISLGSELLYISLTDQDANLNGQSANTLIGTVVTCSTDSETVTLTETGNATEVFRNSGLTTQVYDGSATNNDGTLECTDGTTITATYTDPQDAADTRNDTALATADVIPTAPGSFAGSAPSSTSITWTWSDNSSNETGFKLYDSSNTLIATIATVNATSYTESSLTKGTSYTRKIAAYNAAGNSSYSSSASVTTPAEPTAPSNLAGTADSSTAITWSWTDASNDEATWVLQNSSGTDLASFATSTGSATGGTITYQETGLTKDTAYTRQVVARNTDGTSSPTSQVSVTTKADAPSSPNLVYPSNNVTITTSEATETSFTFNRSTDDDDGISHYLFILNPGASNERTFALGNPEQGATVVYSDRQVTGTAARIFVIFTDSSILPKGSYTWKVRAYDNGSNTGDSDIRAFTVVDEVTTTAATTVALTPALSQSGRGENDDATLAQETATTTPSITEVIERIIQGETPSKAPTGFQLDELMKQARQRSALQANNLRTFLSNLIPYEWLAQFDAMLDNTLATLRSYTLSWFQRTLLAIGRLFDFTGNQLRALAQLWTSGLEQFAAVRREAALALAGFTQEQADTTAQVRRTAQENLTEPLPRLAGAALVWMQDTLSHGYRFLLAGRANRLELAAGQERRFNLVIQPLANAAQWVQLGVRVAWDGARGHYNHPLEIREVAITEVTPQSVVIEWDTSRLTRGKLNWGESISYGNEVHVREYATHHRVELTDLAPGKQYVFEVVATGIRGAQTYDAFYGFTTPAK